MSRTAVTAPQDRLGAWAVGRGREMDVAVDQAGDHIAPRKVDLASIAGLRGQAALCTDRDDTLAIDQYILRRPGRRAGPVDDRCARIEDRPGSDGSSRGDEER
jgi:hypothetical protein